LPPEQAGLLNNTMGSDHSPTLVKIDELGDPHINDYRPHSINMTRADWSQFKRACEHSFKNGENSADHVTLITCMKIWFRIAFLLLKNASLEQIEMSPKTIAVLESEL